MKICWRHSPPLRLLLANFFTIATNPTDRPTCVNVSSCSCQDFLVFGTASFDGHVVISDSSLLPPCLQLLRERYSNLHLALREDLTANLLSRLEGGQLDLALIALPYETGNLMVEPLFDDDLWVVGGKNDPQLNARKVEITPSLTDRLLLLEEGHCLRDHALYACGASTGRSTAGVEATSLLTLVQMIDSGLGIGLVPEIAIKSGLTESPTLVARPMAKPSPKRTIALVARRSTTRLADLKALSEVILKVGRRLGKTAH